MADDRLPCRDNLTDIKDSIDLLTANINRTASNIPYDNNLTIKGKIDAIDSEMLLTDIVRVNVQKTPQYLIIAGITNISNQDGIHIYFSTTSTRNITVYKRENGVTTTLYSFT